MSRRATRPARPARTLSRRTAGVTVAALAAALPVLTAGPALAANDVLGPQEGADLSSGMSVGAALVIFVLVPALIMGLIALVVLLPGIVKADRYRPSKGWSAAPVWFAGPPDPVAAVERADPSGSTRGGASGDW